MRSTAAVAQTEARPAAISIELCLRAAAVPRGTSSSPTTMPIRRGRSGSPGSWKRPGTRPCFRRGTSCRARTSCSRWRRGVAGPGRGDGRARPGRLHEADGGYRYRVSTCEVDDPEYSLQEAAGLAVQAGPYPHFSRGLLTGQPAWSAGQTIGFGDDDAPPGYYEGSPSPRFRDGLLTFSPGAIAALPVRLLGDPLRARAVGRETATFAFPKATSRLMRGFVRGRESISPGLPHAG
jgi:hypothetical protein